MQLQNQLLPYLLKIFQFTARLKKQLFRHSPTQEGIDMFLIFQFLFLFLSLFFFVLVLLSCFLFLFIEPESDHWQCLSLTDSLTNCRLVNFIDVTLLCEDAN